MNDRLAALKVFARAARTGSFTRAGQELGLSQPSASRLVAGLERELGITLLTRNTRAVTLTQAGSDYLNRIEPIIAALEEANQAARGEGELRGTLRVGLPASIAIREVIPRLPRFMSEHKRLKIELAMDDYRQDLVRDAIDVAIRFGTLSDSAAMSKRIGTNYRLLVASPAYLKREGRPKSPADLADHEVIKGPVGSPSDAWEFEKDGRTLAITVDGRFAANVNEAAVAAAVAGLGLLSTGLWGCRAELEDGRLVQVLKDWNMPSAEVHAVFPPGRAAKLAARAFIGFLADELKRPHPVKG
jgi:DNA-binding transcriptional LysR family regulator